jgi:hypothetical protein
MLTRAPFPGYGTDSNKLSYPLAEHRRKRNVHSGAYIHVFCHHVSAAENETRRRTKFFASFGMSSPLNLVGGYLK